MCIEMTKSCFDNTMTMDHALLNGILHCGNALDILKSLPDESIQCCVTSPPYWQLRNYGVEGQIGLEETPEKHLQALVEVFHEVRRVLKSDGTLWLNYGDSYSASGDKSKYNYPEGSLQLTNKGSLNSPSKKCKNLAPKNLLGLPWRLAFALQDVGWILRTDIIWHKPNPMPENVKDRPTRAHEYLFLFSKSSKYFYDNEAIREPVAALSCCTSKVQSKSSLSFARAVQEPERPGQKYAQHRLSRVDKKSCGATRNKRSVWAVPVSACPEAHFATFPQELIKPCILAGSRVGDVILDPFMGSGTTGMVAVNLKRMWRGIELNPKYCKLAIRRIAEQVAEQGS